MPSQAGKVVETGNYLSVSMKKGGKWLYVRDTWGADGAPAPAPAPAAAPKKQRTRAVVGSELEGAAAKVAAHGPAGLRLPREWRDRQPTSGAISPARRAPSDQRASRRTVRRVSPATTLASSAGWIGLARWAWKPASCERSREPG
jgi:hypothetical protein